jgi:hypothetical protein
MPLPIIIRRVPEFKIRLNFERFLVNLVIEQLSMSRVSHAASQVSRLKGKTAAYIRAWNPHRYGGTRVFTGYIWPIWPGGVIENDNVKTAGFLLFEGVVVSGFDLFKMLGEEVYEILCTLAVRHTGI